MRFGIAGAGHPHALGWAQAAKDNGGEIIAIYDPSPAVAADVASQVGGTVADSVEDLDGYGLDAVIVDGRCDEVTEIAIEVAGLGLPILLEKPGGMNAADTKRIADAVEAAGVASQMGYFLRNARPLLEVKEAIANGELGQISLIRGHAAMPHLAWDVMGAWFGDPTNITSIFQEDACHVVDIVVDLFGLPKSVNAVRTKGNFTPSVGEDAIASIWDYGTHLAVVDFTAREANPWIDTWSLEIYGTTGTIRAGFSAEWLERYTKETGWVESGEPRLSGPSDGFARDTSTREHYRIEMESLVNAVRNGGDTSAPARHGYDVFRVVEAIAAAADSGRTVNL
ncbi:MAG: Gfo/Idh/MocA family oxidoreductase [Thermomicrobiales bacterium]|nr:Gfo/Idh/MocA family oxidoreductase [Thermomicrobiales bacterium]